MRRKSFYYSQYQQILWELDIIEESLYILDRKTDNIMTAQADIDAATAAINTMLSDVQGNVTTLVNTDVPAIQAAIAALQAQGVNTAALDAAVAQLQGTTTSLDSAVAQVGALAPPHA